MTGKAPHEVYSETIERMEPEITHVDRDAALASIAISLKRVADSLQTIEVCLEQLEGNLRRSL